MHFGPLISAADPAFRVRGITAEEIDETVTSGVRAFAAAFRKNPMLSPEESLRRLRTAYVDMYWVHLWDPHTPAEEPMPALDDAVRSGKALYVGASDASRVSYGPCAKSAAGDFLAQAGPSAFGAQLMGITDR